MSNFSIKSVPLIDNYSDVENIRGRGAQTLEGEKGRLKKATKEFEAMVFNEMLKTMRRTIPENSVAEGAPMSGGYGKDIFTELFDMQISKRVANGGKGSISDMLYKQLESVIEAEYARQDQNKNDVESLKIDAKEPIKLNKKNFIEQPNLFKALPETENKKEFQPITPLNKKTGSDLIMKKYGDLIEEAARTHQVDSSLIASVIKVESNGNAKAVSPAGAKGLMQLIDSTADDMGVKQVFDPRDNIMAGTGFLKKQLERFGDLKMALAAYNAGPGNVDKYNGIPPFKETSEYVDKVIANIDLFRRAKD